MSDVTHRTELSKDGYERIEVRIQAIETTASNGVFAEEKRTQWFYDIVLEAKKLRQVLREVLLIVPASTATAPTVKGDAA